MHTHSRLTSATGSAVDPQLAFSARSRSGPALARLHDQTEPATPRTHCARLRLQRTSRRSPIPWLGARRKEGALPMQAYPSPSAPATPTDSRVRANGDRPPRRSPGLARAIQMSPKASPACRESSGESTRRADRTGRRVGTIASTRTRSRATGPVSSRAPMHEASLRSTAESAATA
jgi:hypothetical protein